MSKMKKPQFHPLLMLSVVLAVSVSLRVGSGFGPVLATTSPLGAVSGSDGGAMVCGLPELELMYQTLLSDRKALDERLLAASARERDLETADSLIRESFEELQTLQAKLSSEREEFEGERAKVVEDAQADLKQLVQVYESMKPKDAAELFETMSPEFAAGFLGRMQPQIAGEILSAVSSDFAYAVSVLIAARNTKSADFKPQSAQDG
ncbi:MAG: hypothetical protein AAGA38_06660 [Pseudomonadota bacterium]